jgi:arsenite methyltransferase
MADVISTEQVLDASRIKDGVRDHYRRAAASVQGESSEMSAATSDACCEACSALDCGCTDACCGPAMHVWGGAFYDEAVLADVPDRAVLASLGCGNPTAVAELREGETVLDLGSGGGLDVLLSAKRVGPTGKAYGLDITPEMLALAEDNRARAGVTNAEFLFGEIEDIPLMNDSVDVVISNCVVNLSPVKERVFAETNRVLRPGGRLAVTDVVADVSFAERIETGLATDDWANCLGGALGRDEYRTELLAVGFEQVEIVDSHPVGDGFWSAIIRARKPAIAS